MQQNAPVDFTINGRAMRAEPGETALAVARRHGIAIPTLCHHEALMPHGGCRLCVVEVFWGKRSKLVASCIYTPYPDDRIETDNAHVHKIRGLVIEMLLARCPNVEMLRQLGREYGVETARFGADNTESSERCILCGLCVRVCDEIVGQHAIGYANRGTERRITSPFKDQSSACIGCAACVYICPTGALHYQDERHVRTLPELNTRVSLSQCRECGVHYAPVVLIDIVTEKMKRAGIDTAICPACRRRAYGKQAARLLSKGNTFPHTPNGVAGYSCDSGRDGGNTSGELVNEGLNKVS